MEAERHKNPRSPLDEETLERIALHYVARYATTRAKLKSYIARKLRERGWDGGETPPVDRLIERLVAMGYIDDSAFAAARAASLQRRGFGERRVAQALHAAGIAEADSSEAREQARAGAMAAALRFAQRKGLGPYAQSNPDKELRRKAFAAMMRAGHPLDVVRRVIDSLPGEFPDSDID